MGAAECRQEVVKRYFVGEVCRQQRNLHLITLLSKQVINAQSDIYKISRDNSGWIVVRIESSRGRNMQAGCAVIRRCASSNRIRNRGNLSTAVKTNRRLLVAGKGERVRQTCHRACNHATVVTPRQ